MSEGHVCLAYPAGNYSGSNECVNIMFYLHYSVISYTQYKFFSTLCQILKIQHRICLLYIGTLAETHVCTINRFSLR
jgi:hypothetical protein